MLLHLKSPSRNWNPQSLSTCTSIYTMEYYCKWYTELVFREPSIREVLLAQLQLGPHLKSLKKGWSGSCNDPVLAKLAAYLKIICRVECFLAAMLCYCVKKYTESREDGDGGKFFAYVTWMHKNRIQALHVMCKERLSINVTPFTFRDVCYVPMYIVGIRKEGATAPNYLLLMY